MRSHSIHGPCMMMQQGVFEPFFRRRKAEHVELSRAVKNSSCGRMVFALETRQFSLLVSRCEESCEVLCPVEEIMQYLTSLNVFPINGHAFRIYQNSHVFPIV